MTVEIAPGPPLSEDDLAAFETLHGLRLPADYRAWLLLTNGGEPEPNVVLGSENEATVRGFYSVGGEGTWDLAWALRGTGPFPPGCLPIAFEDGGNSYLLTDDGQVLYWDHELELSQPDPHNPGFGPTTVLASLFVEFLEMLLPD